MRELSRNGRIIVKVDNVKDLIMVDAGVTRTGSSEYQRYITDMDNLIGSPASVIQNIFQFTIIASPEPNDFYKYLTYQWHEYYGCHIMAAD